MKDTRRTFIKKTSTAASGLLLGGSMLSACTSSSNSKANKVMPDFDFDISLAQWCFNKALFSGEMDHLDFAKRAKNEFDISGIEYVTHFFLDKAQNLDYLKEMKMRADDFGVTSVLIMVDREGDLASTSKVKLDDSIERHYKWVEAAKFLGCHSIRVNAQGDGTFEDSKLAAIDGLSRLTEFANDFEVGVIVEPHGGFSGHGGWLSDVMKQVNMPGCGTLPDFGNFCLKRDEAYNCLEPYNVYQGTKELMPYAKGVSAKTFDFDENGNEVNYDYRKLFSIIKESGFNGYVGVEYEGKNISPEEGIRLTKSLLERTKKEINNAG
ncbi:MAG: TIM barrel protein [Reichenbachiella sp.]